MNTLLNSLNPPVSSFEKKKQNSSEVSQGIFCIIKVKRMQTGNLSFLKKIFFSS